MPALLSAQLCCLLDNWDGLFLASAARLLTIHFNLLWHFHKVLEAPMGQLPDLIVFIWISCYGWVPLLDRLLLKYHSFPFCPLRLPIQTFAWHYATSQEWA